MVTGSVCDPSKLDFLLTEDWRQSEQFSGQLAELAWIKAPLWVLEHWKPTHQDLELMDPGSHMPHCQLWGLHSQLSESLYIPTCSFLRGVPLATSPWGSPVQCLSAWVQSGPPWRVSPTQSHRGKRDWNPARLLLTKPCILAWGSVCPREEMLFPCTHPVPLLSDHVASGFLSLTILIVVWKNGIYLLRFSRMLNKCSFI